MNEEDRAALFRSQQNSQARYKERAERALRGDPARWKQLHRNWDPLLPTPGWDPPRNPFSDGNEK